MFAESRHRTSRFSYQCQAWRLDMTRCTSVATACIGGHYTCSREGHRRQAESALRRARLERATRPDEVEASP